MDYIGTFLVKQARMSEYVESFLLDIITLYVEYWCRHVTLHCIYILAIYYVCDTGKPADILSHIPSPNTANH